MAEVYGANIATDRPGLAAGAAQIFDTSHLEKQLQDQIDRQRKINELRDQQNAEQLAKIDLNGVRSADQKGVTQKYNDAYSEFRKLQLAQATGDRQGAIAAQSRLDAKKSDLMSFIGTSKYNLANETPQYADIIHNKKDYIPGADVAWQKAMGTPSDDPNYKTHSDISRLIKKPAKVDLNDIGDKGAKESVVPGVPGVVKEGGAKFDQTTEKIDYPIFSKRIELEYSRDYDTKDRIDELYDPRTFDPTKKAELERKVGHSLNSAPAIFAADYFTTNEGRYNKTTRKQLTEKTPRAGGTTITFAGAGIGEPAKTINVASPVPGAFNVSTVTNSAGKKVETKTPRIDQKQTTVVDGMTFPQTKVSISNSPDLRDASTGRPIGGSGIVDLYGSESNILPVYTSGPNKGNIIPDDDKDRALSSGEGKYRVLFHANHGNAIGFTADNNVIFSKDPTPVYLPASSSIIDALQLKTSKDKQPALAAKLSQLYAKVSQLNSSLPKSSSPSASPKKIIHKKISF